MIINTPFPATATTHTARSRRRHKNGSNDKYSRSRHDDPGVYTKQKTQSSRPKQVRTNPLATATAAASNPMAGVAALAEQDLRTLEELAVKGMREKDMAIGFSKAALAEVDRTMASPPPIGGEGYRDMTHLNWCSIDNDDTQDIDQLTFAEKLPDGCTRVLVAIADVDYLVEKDGAVDRDAARNTTTVYTPVKNYSMIPEEYSHGITSLNPHEKRNTMVFEFVVGPDGRVQEDRCDVYRAVVENKAKMAYENVADWLEGKVPEPETCAPVPGMAEAVRLQNEVAQLMRAARFEDGAVDFKTIELEAKKDKDGNFSGVGAGHSRTTHQMIEEFMVAANGVSARFLRDSGMPAVRRVVKEPEKWDAIVSMAKETGGKLPKDPSAPALRDWLHTMEARDPEGFPDLCGRVIRMLGRGEFVVQQPGDDPASHFSLHVEDYAQSTAPNRRYGDLINHRLLKEALDRKEGREPKQPYTLERLQELAERCTAMEEAAEKLERQLDKSAACLVLRDRIGEEFEARVSGASEKGTWVRLKEMPIEGKVVEGGKGWDYGNHVTVKLVDVNVEKGFIDFAAGR